jgi:hypothetical protein
MGFIVQYPSQRIHFQTVVGIELTVGPEKDFYPVRIHNFQFVIGVYQGQYFASLHIETEVKPQIIPQGTESHLRRGFCRPGIGKIFQGVSFFPDW